MVGKYKVITLCGSTRFKDVFMEAQKRLTFIVACVFVLLYGYNRIHMTNHFLTDVCFGTLITYLIYAVVSTAFLRGADMSENKKT